MDLVDSEQMIKSEEAVSGGRRGTELTTRVFDALLEIREIQNEEAIKVAKRRTLSVRKVRAGPLFPWEDGANDNSA